MRFFIIVFFLSSSLASSQKIDVTSGAVPFDGGYDYLVTNNEPVPVTVKLEFKLKNLQSSSTQRIFVIPAYAKNVKVLDLRMIKKDTYGYNVSSYYVYGDQTNSSSTSSFEYHLPYARTASYRVSQGYNGSSSHRGKYAIDFSMREGTPVHAARGGTVIEVKQNESIGCTKPKCLEYANYIRILHSDGTIAEYTHLKVNGSLVRKGDQVTIDDHIGYSGNTGWTTGPHLHFTVYRPRFGTSSKTIPVKFWLGKSVVVNELKENQHYRKP